MHHSLRVNPITLWFLFFSTLFCGGCSYEAKLQELGGKAILQIDLSNSQVTDTDLESLDLPTNTRRIFLKNTQVSDSGVDALRRYENLEFIDLSGTQITSESLDKLKSFPNLRSASVRADNVDPKEIRAFLKYLREKEVERAKNSNSNEAIRNSIFHTEAPH